MHSFIAHATTLLSRKRLLPFYFREWANLIAVVLLTAEESFESRRTILKKQKGKVRKVAETNKEEDGNDLYRAALRAAVIL